MLVDTMTSARHACLRLMSDDETQYRQPRYYYFDMTRCASLFDDPAVNLQQTSFTPYARRLRRLFLFFAPRPPIILLEITILPVT
jgi:hypothetical protein